MVMPNGISLTLSGNPPTVIRFDQDVLECLFEDGSTRVHVVHLKGLELADNRDKYLLTIHLNRRDLLVWVDNKQLAVVKELVDQVNQAISAFKAQSSGQ
jgi:hypothetical protein